MTHFPAVKEYSSSSKQHPSKPLTFCKQRDTWGSPRDPVSGVTVKTWCHLPFALSQSCLSFVTFHTLPVYTTGFVTFGSLLLRLVSSVYWLCHRCRNYFNYTQAQLHQSFYYWSITKFILSKCAKYLNSFTASTESISNCSLQVSNNVWILNATRGTLPVTLLTCKVPYVLKDSIWKSDGTIGGQTIECKSLSLDVQSWHLNL